MDMEEGEGVFEELECFDFKTDTNESLPKLNINTRLAAQILSSEASNGSFGQNVVCSPLSLEFALHMVGAGSKGDTLSQILQFLGSKNYPLHSMEEFNLKSLGIMRVASSFCKPECKKVEKDKIWFQVEEQEPELSFANGVWVDQCYTLKPSYKELMSSIYNARAETVDFKNQSERICEDINSWVAEKTKGLIEKMLENLEPTVMLVLVNALYFKGAWSSPFDAERTKDFDFHLLDGSKLSVPFMSNNAKAHFFRAFDGFKVVKLNYQRGEDMHRKFSMLILLPDEKDGLQDLVKKCVSDPEFLNQDFGLKVEAFDYMWIPKFKFSYTIDDVKGVMKGLGLTLPFMPKCKDLTEIVELGHENSLRVSKILHKAIIEIDESGTEAAAVTEVEFEESWILDYEPPPGIRFIADHPFVFMIKEEMSGAIFFVGAVLNPEHSVPE